MIPFSMDSPIFSRANLMKAGLAMAAAAFSVLLVFIWGFLLSPAIPFAGAAALTAVLVIAYFISLPRIQKGLGKIVDRFYFGRSSASRAALTQFPHSVQASIDIEKIAPPFLALLSDCFQAQQTTILLEMEGSYISRYSSRNLKFGLTRPILIKKDSPCVVQLQKNGRPIILEDLDLAALSFALEPGVKSDFKSAEAEVLCPLSHQQRLVGILILSRKYPGGNYSSGDIKLIQRLCDEIAPTLENALLYDRARERANTDELTGLFNRGFFQSRLEEEIARSSRYGEVFSLIMIDVDDFKKANDAGGHQGGDQVLKTICKFIQTVVRNSDICFRYGGDEFAIILPQTTTEGGRAVAERIRKGVESLDEFPFPQTVSLGVAAWPTDGVLKDDLIRSADAALYHSKQTGKNRVNLACQVALSQVFRIEAAVDTSDSDSRAQVQTIHSLAVNIDNRDPYTTKHSLKVSYYGTLIAEALGFAPEDIQRIKTAGLLHDVGKIGIPEEILKKQGPLTPDEMEIIQAHPNLGVSITEHIQVLRDCLAGIQYHHEHFDGSGYPSGLSANNIPLDARILAVADSFDAMTSPRPYRKIMTRDEALQEIKACSGTQFDPQIVEVFVNLQNLDPNTAGQLQQAHSR